MVERIINKYAAYQWWQWAKLLAIVLLPLTLTGNAVVMAVVIHLLCDFTLQSGETAMRKGERGKHLIVHSLIVGGISGAVCGLFASGWSMLLVGVVIGSISHYAVDYTKKFGIKAWYIAIAVDQILHIAALVLIASL